MATFDADINWTWGGGKIVGFIEHPKRDLSECNICNFDAYPKGQGNGRRALTELRSKYRIIRADGIGDETNPNRGFWFKMAQEGLVDVLIERDGTIAWPAAHAP